MMTQGVSQHSAALWLVRQLQELIQESGMENTMKTMHELFPMRTVVIEQSLDMFGVKRNEDGRYSSPVTPINVFPLHVSVSDWRLMAGEENA